MSEISKIAYISFRSHLKTAECILIESKWPIHGSHVWGYVPGLVFIKFTANAPNFEFAGTKMTK